MLGIVGGCVVGGWKAVLVQVGTHHAGCELAALNPSDSDSTELSDLDLDTNTATVHSRLGPGSLFRLRFLGSVAVDEEERATAKRRLKKTMVEEAVLKIKVIFLVRYFFGTTLNFALLVFFRDFS